MRVRLATEADCRLLPEIEASAARAFADIGMHDVAGDEPTRAEAWEPHCASQTLWVAVDEGDVPFGFLAAGAQPDHLFIYELAVAHGRQRRGAGRALLAAAEAAAKAQELDAVYLTTFCEVPFNGPYYAGLVNGPYYAGLGYAVVPDDRLPDMLKPVMDAERRRWILPGRRRCAMRKGV